MNEASIGRARYIAQWLYQRGKAVAVALAILFAFVVGYAMNSDPGTTTQATGASATQPSTQPATQSAPAVEYTCSMHPQVRMPNPDDRCPICGMALIPVASEDAHDTGSSTEPSTVLTMTPEAAALMDVEVSPVIRAPARVGVRMVGKIEVDETRLSYITAWVPGRIDRLYVDYTGTPINKGDHLAEFYSTDLLVAQEELIQALSALDRIGDDAATSARRTQTALLEASREKLRLWGLLPEQIASIEENRSATDHTTLYSPVSGIVFEKHATLGQYLDTGSMVYTIADLSSVWVILEAYESDLVWLRYGQKVEFTTEAYPGETFTGLISFIDPILDEKRRVVRVRVNAPNADGKLKPGMFAKAQAHAIVAAGGKVLAPELEGKWVGPMHPEIVKDGPGTCDICEMPLVRAEDLGYTTAGNVSDPLLVPATAVLRTGRRAIVYLSTGTHDKPMFEAREVVLGSKAGDMFIVNTGLNEGDLVVTNGNFKIDSALQIRAKPSMMNPQGGNTTTGHQHGGTNAPPPTQTAPMAMTSPAQDPAFTDGFQALIRSYFAVSAALADDDLKAARESIKQAGSAIAEIDTASLSDADRLAWEQSDKAMRSGLDQAASAQDLDTMRAAFAPLSDEVIEAVQRFGQGMDTPVYQVHCPMAMQFAGADWVQPDPKIANPYFGASMLTCGTVTQTLIDPANTTKTHQHAN